jgi:hypothetical protein
MAHIRRIALAWLAVAVLLTAGCTFGPTRLEADYGNSLSLAKFQQVLDPMAARNLEPVYGFDGVAASRTMTIFGETFRRRIDDPPGLEIPPEQKRFILLGGEGATGGQ